MINLLKDEKFEKYDNAGAYKKGEVKDSQFPEKLPESPGKKIDIKDYKDSEGLTVSKMDVGLWLVRNRKNFLKIVYGILILISTVTWSVFFYNFGLYLIKGIKEDRQLVAALTLVNSVGHDIVLRQAAQPLLFSPIQSIETAKGQYDLLIEVTNPNKTHWGELSYTFYSGNNTYGRATNFILPGETKHFFSLNQKIVSSVDLIRFRVDKIFWGRINNHNFPDWDNFKKERLNFEITDSKFIPAQESSLSEKVSLNELSFKASNHTAYNFYSIDLIATLYGRSDKIIGINQLSIGRFMSGDIREVKMTWTGQIGAVRDIIIRPELNITRNDIYIPIQGGPGDLK